ncbi:DNA repair protein RecO [Candidatus Woesebacteria bacterium]|nr:DNA repair protein RecO [Candidatus Woesebacteria bacterium]
MKYHKYHAIVINRRNIKDADRFLTLYTLESGKVDVYARSVRSLKSKRLASLDLFTHISCEAIEKNDRLTLTHVDLLHTHQDSKTSLANISRLFQIGELVDKLTPDGDPHPEVYNLLLTALTHLHRFDTPEYLTRFKKKLLTELGFDPDPADLDAYIESLLSRPLRTRHIL